MKKTKIFKCLMAGIVIQAFVCAAHADIPRQRYRHVKDEVYRRVDDLKTPAKLDVADKIYRHIINDPSATWANHKDKIEAAIDRYNVIFDRKKKIKALVEKRAKIQSKKSIEASSMPKGDQNWGDKIPGLVDATDYLQDKIEEALYYQEKGKAQSFLNELHGVVDFATFVATNLSKSDYQKNESFLSYIHDTYTLLRNKLRSVK